MRSKIKPTIYLFNSEKNKKYFCKKYIIFKKLVSSRVYVYNGNKFHSVVVKSVMLGKKLGFFFLTKKIGGNIHVKKTRKKK